MAFALFDTKLGPCGLVWSQRGLVRLVLPEGSRAATEARVRAQEGDIQERPPPPWVRAAMRAVARELGGGASAPVEAPLDLARTSSFAQSVYDALRGVQRGATITYGALAEAAGASGAARAVGRAMAHNPLPIIIPCHRVVGANGRPGGFSARGGVVTKARLLALEGVALALPDALPYDAEAAVRSLSRQDPVLRALMRRVGPFRMERSRARSTFASLARAIVYQQLTGRVAATIFGRVCALFPGRRELRAEDVAAASEARLRSAGLSGAKAAALSDLAQKTLAGKVPSLRKLATMPDEAIVETLTEVRGVGRWTVEMLLLFQLGRPDVLPLGDYAIRKAFALTYGLREVPKPQLLAERGERWRPYRSVASWYLWRALEL